MFKMNFKLTNQMESYSFFVSDILMLFLNISFIMIIVIGW